MIHAAHKRKTDSDDDLFEAQCGDEVGGSYVVTAVLLLKFEEVAASPNLKALCKPCLFILNGRGLE